MTQVNRKSALPSVSLADDFYVKLISKRDIQCESAKFKKLFTACYLGLGCQGQGAMKYIMCRVKPKGIGIK